MRKRMIQKRNALLAMLVGAVLCPGTNIAPAQTPHPVQPGHRSPIHTKQEAVVRIKNGPVVRGRIVQADEDSILLEVADRGCPVTLDPEEVASIVYPAAIEVVKQAPQKSPQRVKVDKKGDAAGKRRAGRKHDAVARLARPSPL